MSVMHSSSQIPESLENAGSAVYYYGISNFDHGSTKVILDGIPAIISSETAVYLHQTLLFQRTGLANTAHTLILTNVPVNNGAWMNVDLIMSVFLLFVLTVINEFMSSYTTDNPNQPNTAPKSSLSVGDKVAIGICSSISVLSILVFFSFRSKILQSLRRGGNADTGKSGHADTEKIAVTGQLFRA